MKINPLIQKVATDAAYKEIEGKEAPVSIDGSLSELEQEKLKLKKATTEFESFFSAAMLKSMRATVPKADADGLNLGGGLGKDIFEEIFDQELAKHIANNSKSGLGEKLYQSLLPRVESQFETPTVGKGKDDRDE